MTDELQCVEVDTGGTVRSAVIWLHGLGADGHDFEPIVPSLGLRGCGVRFVFPHAPRRAVTINMGLLMRAWFDISDPEFRGGADERGIRESVMQVTGLVDRERGRGIASGRIVLAGFSQGGAIALHVALRYAETLCGVIALSTYLAGGAALEAELNLANGRIPIFQAHGADDPLIPMERGEETRDRLLALGHPVVWKAYPMQHEVCLEEIADLGVWLRGRLAG
ncbi:MAG: carboxylesterase [Acidobacteria bacterium 13_1_40CM_4_69_4]|nr:MAG: carboxylesterase [Acidobacteria bacterium 13_1_40CM_4_69_4]